MSIFNYYCTSVESLDLDLHISYGSYSPKKINILLNKIMHYNWANNVHFLIKKTKNIQVNVVSYTSNWIKFSWIMSIANGTSCGNIKKPVIVSSTLILDFDML